MLKTYELKKDLVENRWELGCSAGHVQVKWGWEEVAPG